MIRFVFTSVCLFISLAAFSQQKYIELGDVDWLRNYEEAVTESKKQNKDIFLLFQEVPGCSTCKNYGVNILQHPLIVETVEDLFIPLAIFNNKQGHDEEILKKFNEPAWNNPVARIINTEGNDVVPRLSGQYNTYAVLQLIIDALLERGLEIPTYLSLLSEEFQSELLGTKETVISMYCFWSGEKNIGKLKGVKYTEAGFMDGKEVVKVIYSPTMISYEELLMHASKTKCAASVFTDDNSEKIEARKILGNANSSSVKAYRKDREDKYYLRHSDIQYIPLTDLQKTRINSMLGDRLDPSELLSPRQLAMLGKLDTKQSKSLVGREFREAWTELAQTLRSE